MKRPAGYKVFAFIWMFIGLYFLGVAVMGGLFVTDLDATENYRNAVIESLILVLAYGLASIACSYGIYTNKGWSAKLLKLLSFTVVGYGLLFFVKGWTHETGASEIVMVSVLITVSVFSVLYFRMNSLAKSSDAK